MHFNCVWEMLQREILDMLRAGELAPNFGTIAKGWIGSRVFIRCKYKFTAKFIEKVVKTLAVKEKDSGTITSFKAWRKGTSGTTLITVVVPELGDPRTMRSHTQATGAGQGNFSPPKWV